LSGGDGPVFPPHIQRLGITAEHNRNDLRITSDPADRGGAQGRSAVQGGGADPVDQGVQIEEDADVGLLPTPGGQVVAVGGAVDDVGEGIAVSLPHRPRIGDPVGEGLGFAERVEEFVELFGGFGFDLTPKRHPPIALALVFEDVDRFGLLVLDVRVVPVLVQPVQQVVAGAAHQ
jgi:hypothetical protein